MFKIGNIEIKNNVVLAPMAGISNPTYIKICESMGLGYAITELISAEAITRRNKKTLDMLKGLDEIKIPVAIQIFGSNPNTLAKAASILEKEFNAKIIDINMGCPVPKVAIKNDAGSALLKNPELVKEIVSKVSSSVSVPVTVKIRIGWDEKHINCVEIAKIVEASGANAISIHARTRSQGYSGVADWSKIKEVKENVNIPVIGNGDIKTPLDAKRMLDETGCDAIMIGRALLGNPWLIKNTVDYLDKNILNKEVSYEEKIKMMKYHLHLLCDEIGEKPAVMQIRTHFLFYLKGMPNNAEIKNNICKCTSEKEIIELLDNYQRTLL